MNKKGQVILGVLLLGSFLLTLFIGLPIGIAIFKSGTLIIWIIGGVIALFLIKKLFR